MSKIVLFLWFFVILFILTVLSVLKEITHFDRPDRKYALEWCKRNPEKVYHRGPDSFECEYVLERFR